MDEEECFKALAEIIKDLSDLNEKVEKLANFLTGDGKVHNKLPKVIIDAFTHRDA